MFSLLLAIIYISFISLGLPDSLLGASWPAMHTDVGASIESAGLVTMVIAIGTVISSLLSSKLTHKFGTGVVTAASVLLTAIALFGFSFCTSLPMLMAIALPFGLGAGAVDAALNNYVAQNYSSKHMNWLHAFWGVGASISPYIMAFALTGGLAWTGGYRIVGLIQITICALLFLSLRKWKKPVGEEVSEKSNISLRDALKIPGVKFPLLAFLAYCGAEFTVGAYAASYLVDFKNMPPEYAASFASFLYIGITAGRFLCGFVSEKLGDKRMIRFGMCVLIFGITLVIIPVDTDILSLSGLIILGMGCAPIYPAIIHSTPANFGNENSATVIGMEMASAYTGTTLLPPLFAIIASSTGMGAFPFFLLALAVLSFFAISLTHRAVKHHNTKRGV